MKFSNLYKILLLSLLSVCTMSCEETKEAGEYDNWRARNDVYIDSIAKVAKENTSGDWKTFLCFSLIDSLSWGNQYKVYCQVLQAGNGAQSPSYSDTVIVNYRGRLIPSKNYPKGYVFDESYTGNLDPLIDVPQKLNLAGRVKGWITAMLKMVDGTTISSGDVWRVYVPSELGYSSQQNSGVPPFSTIIYDINLVDFYPIGTPVPDIY